MLILDNYMKTKILVASRECKPMWGKEICIDSRFFYSDTLNPIVYIAYDPYERPYDLQMSISSKFIAEARREVIDSHYKEELDKIFPEGYEFEFYLITHEFAKIESKFWWDTLVQSLKTQYLINYFHEYNPKPATESEIRSLGKFTPDAELIKKLWIKNEMIQSAIKNLKPL